MQALRARRLTPVGVARHLGAWLVMAALIVALWDFSPSWPVTVAGCLGATLFTYAEVSELLDHRP